MLEAAASRMASAYVLTFPASTSLPPWSVLSRSAKSGADGSSCIRRLSTSTGSSNVGENNDMVLRTSSTSDRLAACIASAVAA